MHSTNPDISSSLERGACAPSQDWEPLAAAWALFWAFTRSGSAASWQPSATAGQLATVAEPPVASPALQEPRNASVESAPYLWTPCLWLGFVRGFPSLAWHSLHQEL
eukprot:2941881-Amphidinium_carterae.1